MFSKGSRYRNLAETIFLNAQGERVQGKVLRRMRRPSDPSANGTFENRFQHTVLTGDRLDLLAYKYYSDTTRWWLISDGNPEWPYPLDLLDERPLVEETFRLTHIAFQGRYFELIVALGGIGEVHANSVSFFSLDEKEDFETRQELDPSFLEENVLVVYAPTRRNDLLNAMQTRGFRRLRSFGFPFGGRFAESFVLDDPAAKVDWQTLLDDLHATPGLVDVQTELTESTLDIVYNSAAISRESLVNLISSHGFDFEAIPYSRVGRKIRIPPNQFV